MDSARWDLESFVGFKAAIVATHCDWSAYPIRGLTYEEPSDLPQTGSATQLSLALPVDGSEAEGARSSASPSLPVLRPTTTKHIVSSLPTPPSPLPSSHRAHAATNTEQEPRTLPRPVPSPPRPLEEEAAEEQVEEVEDPLTLVAAELTALAPVRDERELRFSWCQALHAHGHPEHAWKLAVEMAEDLLSKPPDLMRELPPPIKVPSSCKAAGAGLKKKRKGGDERMPHPLAVAISMEASATLERAGFLFDVLLRGPAQQFLAFRVALLALEMPRQAAATKFLEVKMNQQEAELLGALRRLELGSRELEMVRERARRLRAPAQPPPPVLPFALSAFVFHVLSRRGLGPEDERLAFDAAITTLGLRSPVSEADHPLLCEATRRQRGELAITLLLRYKDEPERLNCIMSTLLDPEMHQMFPSRSKSLLPS